MLFKEIPGHQEVKEKLIQGIRANRIAHAQLFMGQTGYGSLALAIAYARYLNCSNRKESDSCSNCPSCIKYAKLIHPDLHFSFPVVTKKGAEKPKSSDYLKEWREFILANPYPDINQWLYSIDAGNKQGNITVDECHDIIRKLSLKAFEAPYKVLIMWLPEYLGKSGNTLLKLIEEPPAQTLIMLVSENRDLLLPTITSRTQLVKVNRYTNEELMDFAMKLPGMTSEQAGYMVQMADGNLSELLQHSEGADQENDFTKMLLDWFRQCYKGTGNATDILGIVDQFAQSGREKQKSFLQYALHICRQCFLISSGLLQLSNMSKTEQSAFQKMAAFIHADNCQGIADEFNKAYYHIERNGNPKIVFFDLSLKIGTLLRVPLQQKA